MRKLTKREKSLIHFCELAAVLHDVGKLSRAFIEYRKIWHNLENGFDSDPHDHGFWSGSKADSVFDKYSKLNRAATRRIPWRSALEGRLGFSFFSFLTFSIARCVNSHTKPKHNVLLQILKAADALDSAQDRNNPLWSAEQCYRCRSAGEQHVDELFKTSPFGKESLMDVAKFEHQRETLYRHLDENLSSYLAALKRNDQEIDFHRQQIMSCIRTAFEQGLSDSTRPQNDTTLWDHCYAVASLFKVLLVQWLWYGRPITNFNKIQFAVWGVGWDAFAYWGKSIRIGDLVGRQRELEGLKNAIRAKVEVEWAIGNSIYEDDDGIYFMIPANMTGKARDQRYEKTLQALEAEIFRLANEHCHGELVPVFAGKDADNDVPNAISADKRTFVTSIVQVVENIRKQSGIPIHRQFLLNSLEWEQGKDSGELCPVCQKRVQQEKLKVCTVCMGRRTDEGTEKEILLHSEIADSNGRLALIVAAIDLTHWLDGSLVRTLFITEAHGAQNELLDLGNTLQFSAEEDRLKEIARQLALDRLTDGYDYDKLLEDLQRCRFFDAGKPDELAKAVRLLFCYRNPKQYAEPEKDISQYQGEKGIWRQLINATIDEHREQRMSWKNLTEDQILLNSLCAKTPTPSTLLSIWHNTEEFFQSFTKGDSLGKYLFANASQPCHVIFKLSGQAMDGYHNNAVYNGTLHAQDKNNQAIRRSVQFIVRRSGEELHLTKPVSAKGDWPNLKLEKLSEIKPDDAKGNVFLPDIPLESQAGFREFYPVRPISHSPHLLMLLVPANQALPAVQLIHEAYEMEFSKVQGHLPLGIGTIFFTEQMPMSVVMDSARRMVDNFRAIWGNKPQELEITGTTPERSSFTGKLKGESHELEWKFERQLGENGKYSNAQKIDYHHPYVILSPAGVSEETLKRKNYFATVAGPVVHSSEVAKGDVLRWVPNLFDYQFLDSSARRFEITASSDLSEKRPHLVPEKGTCPMQLETLMQKIADLWKILQKSALTDTKLRDIEAMLLQRLRDWKPGESFDEFAKDLIEIEIPKLDDEKRQIVHEAVRTGLFFDGAEIKQHILKKKNAENVFIEEE